ncbi:hypothetical protein LGV61_02515 [Desulfurispirillum indicum]|uniref:hypothetical protein n=1 Tax=Desulfurispirillum indicum TaxID=936456 RepID=UPI001CF9F396|nr:hypothetical protein [Desulfurispirillum indicum]UCZ57170.1 hypothetical protein LGV61_02515 [Desulfurispirillum indicum]
MRAGFVAALLVSGLVFVSGCSEQSAPEVSGASSAPAAAQQQAHLMGTVIETMNVAGYTYVQLDADGESLWFAGPETVVSEGDRVMVIDGMVMEDFYSRSLDRTFEKLIFVGAFVLEGGEMPQQQPGLPAGHPPLGADAQK